MGPSIVQHATVPSNPQLCQHEFLSRGWRGAVLIGTVQLGCRDKHADGCPVPAVARGRDLRWGKGRLSPTVAPSAPNPCPGIPPSCLRVEGSAVVHKPRSPYWPENDASRLRTANEPVARPDRCTRPGAQRHPWGTTWALLPSGPRCPYKRQTWRWRCCHWSKRGCEYQPLVELRRQVLRWPSIRHCGAPGRGWQVQNARPGGRTLREPNFSPRLIKVYG